MKYIPLLLIVAGCVTGQKYGAQVKVIERGAVGAGVSYKPYTYMCEETKEECRVEMLDSSATAERMSIVPVGGCLIIKTAQSTIESANPKWYTYIIQDSTGKEIARQDGEDRIPTYQIVGSTTIWNGFDIWYLNFPIPQTFNVYIVNRISNKRAGFEIRY